MDRPSSHRRPPAEPGRKHVTSSDTARRPQCRACAAPLERTFVDLGTSPPCEDFLTADRLSEPETTYPLHVFTCTSCLLVQLPAHVEAREVFDDYAYFSSFSTSWVEHARAFVDQAVERLRPGPDEPGRRGRQQRRLPPAARRRRPASPHWAWRRPTTSHRRRATRASRPTTCYLDAESGARIAARARRRRPRGRQQRARPRARPQRLRRRSAGARARRRLGDAWSSRTCCAWWSSASTTRSTTSTSATSRSGRPPSRSPVVACPSSTSRSSAPTAARCACGAGRRRSALPCPEPSRRCSSDEARAGLHTVEGHDGFEQAVFDVKQGLLRFLLDARQAGRSVAGYGAPGKGNTLLNHCGVRADLLPYTVDRNPYKHGRFLPGSHIPVLPTGRAGPAPTRLRAPPALEPAGRAQHPAGSRARLGRPTGRARSPHWRSCRMRGTS